MPEQAKSNVARFLASTDRELVRSTSLFMYWVADGMFRAGFGQEALRVLKTRFRHMLDSGLGTLWEEWSASGEWALVFRSRPAAGHESWWMGA